MSALPEFVWLNGDVVRTSEARLSPFEHGFTVGMACSRRWRFATVRSARWSGITFG